MVSVVGAICAFAYTLCGVAVLVQRGGHKIYDYAVTQALIVRLLGRICVYRIPLADIADARLWRMAWPKVSSAFSTLRLGNRVFGPAIVITRRQAFPHYVIITPDDPHGMLALLRLQ